MDPIDEREKCVVCKNFADLVLNGKPVCYTCYDKLQKLKDMANKDLKEKRWY